MKRNDSAVKKIAVYGLLIALALIFSYIEAQIPAFFAFPGMKLGLTNVVVLTALYKMGSGHAMGINILRIGLVSVLFGGAAAFLYSLAGGMLSTAVMILLKKTGFRTVTVSIAGGISRKPQHRQIPAYRRSIHNSHSNKYLSYIMGNAPRYAYRNCTKAGFFEQYHHRC